MFTHDEQNIKAGRNGVFTMLSMGMTGSQTAERTKKTARGNPLGLTRRKDTVLEHILNGTENEHAKYSR